jgi:hypothetical protein
MNRTRCARCDAPLDERWRSDRRTCRTACRVALWRLGKAATAAYRDRAEHVATTAPMRRHGAS